MFKDFIKKISSYRKISVFSHVRPDGDCIGSQVALCRYLTDKGFEVSAWNDDDITPNMQWIRDFFPIGKPDSSSVKDADLLILMDGNASHRFGEMAEWQNEAGKPWLIIDHHPDPEEGFDHLFSDPTASSTCEMVYRLISEDDPDLIDEKMAKALYAGIITDTGSLQFDSVTPETVEVVADLLRRGSFKPNEVIEELYSNRSVRQYRLLSRALSTVELRSDNQVAIMSVTEGMLNETDTVNADTEGFVDYPLRISGVKAAVIFKDLGEDGVKMSLRSRSDVDVNVWARELGGGGHKKAAGAWHPGPLSKAISETIEIGNKQLKRDKKTTPS
ncbi:MAG: bifunctional oligoribonuclease/PAP phosphatase NrnA [Balneolaceae bacterium]|nr:bifunctional oligoribonuclease/PAP phosphatase NrnA [Balneolaceae bacterium]MCH8548087.1 bifunctional oligoribonuclease/PAP phosphatase NrnA [Balneolaceae bacterium]